MNTLPRTLVLLTIGVTVLTANAFAASPLLKEIENAFVSLGENVGPSVVEISSEGGQISAEDRGNLEELFKNFFDAPNGEPHPVPPDMQQRPPATGSGFIYDAQGHVITNNHVVEGAKDITVKLSDGTEHDATVVGTDPDSDLAVVKIDAAGLNLRPVKLADSDSLRVGQFAIALGSPRGLTGSVSFGHISALGRDELRLPIRLRFTHFIQTDAAINLGNSGGPLCNIDGEVIGVNVAIAYGANSIGFAIPIDRVLEVVPQLISGGKVIRGWLGVGIRPLSAVAAFDKQEIEDYLKVYNLPDESGAHVDTITWLGPSEHAELKSKDVIRELNGKAVKDPRDLIDRISAMKPGTSATLRIWRAGDPTKIEVAVGEFPGERAAYFGPSFLGIHVEELEITEEDAKRAGFTNPPTGVTVPIHGPGGIVPESAAADADIRPGDFIAKIAHQDVTDRETFRSLINEHATPGEPLLIQIYRNSNELQDKIVKVPNDFEAH
jgi:serine protease Do